MLLQALPLPAGNYTLSSAFATGGSSDYIILIAIALYLTFRTYRSVTGTRYSTYRLYLLPVAYLFLVLLTLVELSVSAVDAIAVFVSVAAGALAGLRLAGGVKFYEKNGQTYYKRSPFVMVIWLLSYIGRFAVSLLIPSDFYVNFAVEIVLALTTGVILGEAYHIYNNYKKHQAAGRKADEQA